MGDFSDFQQTRTAIGAPNTWVALTVPVGARNALVLLEDQTAVMRISSDNTVLAGSQGTPVLAGGSYQFEGTSTGVVTVYVAADKATAAVVQFTTA